MSGFTAAMVQSYTQRLKLTLLFLLVSISAVSLHNTTVTGNHSLHCVTDYLFTINCSLTIEPSQNTSDSDPSYWLTLTDNEEKTFVCNLKNAYGISSCSVTKSDFDQDSDIFTDLDSVTISLRRKQNDAPENCTVLVKDFIPHINIKPNAPCCLTVTHSSNQHQFTWKSTYEEYCYRTSLFEKLQYQLHYYTRGDKQNVIPRVINTDSTNYSVDDQEFAPDTEYIARVRSSPNQAFFKGHYSDWSSEVQWKVESHINKPSTKTFVFNLGKKVFIPLCVMVAFILFLCYAPVVKWRQKAFIPTPAPYFHTLYSDFQGDFKSWVVTQENSADMLKGEETLQIDTLTKCADVQEEARQPQHHHQLMEGSAYSNVVDQSCNNSLLGTPYAVSTTASRSVEGSFLNNVTLISQPGSPAEGDSGCWLCSNSSLEKDPPWYCNEYCTLSTFQQSTPKHHGSSCPQEIML